MERSDEAFRLCGHAAGKFLRCVCRKPINAAVNLSEVEVPGLVWRAAVAGSLRGHDEYALAGDITEVVVIYPPAVGDHLVDHETTQVRDGNSGEQSPLFARGHVDWIGTAHGDDTK